MTLKNSELAQIVTVKQQHSRTRGAILTDAGCEKLRRSGALQDSQGSRLTFEMLGGRSQISARTISKILSQIQGVDKSTLKQFFAAFHLRLEPTDYMTANLEDQTKRRDLRDAIEVFNFHGRQAELATLKQWIVQDRSRVVAIVGMGGIGKTVLSAQLTEQIQDQFEFVAWKTLRTAPSLCDLLGDLILFLSQRQETDLPKSVGYRLSLLMQYLTQYSCLLVLDNVETIFQSGTKVGVYKPGYEAYGELFRQLAELRHRSCIVLTSREKPKELKEVEHRTATRCLELQGLNKDEGRALFDAKGSFSGSAADWQEMIAHYGGNPLALEIVASMVREYLHGDITEFVHYLRQGQLLFEDVNDLLEQQINRLSDLERRVIQWLATRQEWATLTEVQANLFPHVTIGDVLEAIESLRRRSLIKSKISINPPVFTLQPVVMEYVKAHLMPRRVERFQQSSDAE